MVLASTVLTSGLVYQVARRDHGACSSVVKRAGKSVVVRGPIVTIDLQADSRGSTCIGADTFIAVGVLSHWFAARLDV